jgi:hypothetical protein
VLVGAHSVDHFISVFLGNFGAHLAYLGYTVAVCPTATDKDATLMICLDSRQAGQVSGVRVDGKSINDYFYSPLTLRSFVETNKLIGNPPTALSNTDDD